MTKNEEEHGANPYAGGSKSVAAALVSRKRNIQKERQISPIAFNSTVRTSNRFDDKMKAKTLNQYNGEKLEQMMVMHSQHSR